MSGQATTPQKENAFAAFLKRRWLAILIVVVAVVIIAANRQEVEFSIVFTHFAMPLWVILAVTFVLGAIVGWIAKTRRASRKS
ncbi:MAG: LapA family protein [Cellulomonas sp.]